MPTEKRQRKKEGHQARIAAARAAAQRARRRRRALQAGVATAAVIGLIFVLANVGGGDHSSDVSSSGTTSTSQATTTRAPSTSSTVAPTKPSVTVPKGPAPATLQSTDLKVGDGPEAQNGDTITVEYVGVQYADGKEFDSSYGKQPATFELAQGKLIDGWVQGIPGMKVGGRRQLVIPGSLAYGDQDTGDGRPHGALVFVIDLLGVSHPK